MMLSFRKAVIVSLFVLIVLVIGISFTNSYSLFVKDKEAESVSSLVTMAKAEAQGLRDEIIDLNLELVEEVERVDGGAKIDRGETELKYLALYSRGTGAREDIFDSGEIESSSIVSEFIRSDEQYRYVSATGKIYFFRKLISENGNKLYVYASQIREPKTGKVLVLADPLLVEKITKKIKGGREKLMTSVPLVDGLSFVKEVDLADFNALPSYVVENLIKTSIIVLLAIGLIALMISGLISRPLYALAEIIKKYDMSNKVIFEKKSNIKEIQGIQDSFEKLTTRLSGFQLMMFSSIDQGLFIINKDLTLGEIYSSECLRIFGRPPSGKNFVEYVNIGNNINVDQIREWLRLVFDGVVELEDVRSLSLEFVQSDESPMDKNYKRVDLQYYEIKEDGKLLSLLVVSKDVSQIYKDKARLKMLSEKTELITCYYRNKSNYHATIEDARNMFKKIERFGDTENYSNREVKGLLHTLKGILGIYGFKASQRIIHTVESLCLNNDPYGDELKNALDIFMDDLKYIEKETGENILENNSGRGFLVSYIDEALKIKDSNGELVARAFNEMKVGRSLIEKLTEYGRFISEFGIEREKKIDGIEIIGSDFYYENRYSDFINNLVHVFKNIVEHGVESSVDRINNLKPEMSRIVVELNNLEERYSSGFLLMSIIDDGAGFNFEKIRNKLGVDEKVSESELLDMVLKGDLAQGDNVNIDSGRSVGLVSFYDSIASLGGNLKIRSSESGTRFEIAVPLF